MAYQKKGYLCAVIPKWLVQLLFIRFRKKLPKALFMKTKLVLWAIQTTNEQPEEKVLLALELHPDENKVTAWVFGGESASQEFSDQLMNHWRKGEAVAFPESAVKFVQDLSASSNLLPDSLRPEKEELLKRSQTEWLFIVLSTKLYRAYLAELEELHEGVNKLEYYDKASWDSMKAFWDKVQTQINEQNLFREHADLLRERTNAIFAQMKQLRSVEDTAFETEAKKNYDDTVARLENIESQLGTTETSRLFEELKEIQKEFKNLKLTRSLRSDLWNRIDESFKIVKGKRSGASSSNNNNQSTGSPEVRLSRRIEGLQEAIQKMEESINRDQQELDIQNKKIASPESSQLETQLREVRAKLIQERIDSKNVKLDDMRKTLAELSSRSKTAPAETVVSTETESDESEITTL